LKEYRTTQRNLLAAFFEKHCDERLSIDQIMEALPSASAISRSAIYRNVDRMVQDGLLRKSAQAGSRKFLYRYIGGGKCCQRLHLQCTKCGRIFHLEDQAGETVRQAALRKNGFQIDEQQTMLYGLCKNCI